MTDDGAALLATQLSVAHRRVRDLDLPDEEKALATRRLLAISDAAKHDIERASRRLRAFLEDLDEGRVSAKERPVEG